MQINFTLPVILNGIVIILGLFASICLLLKKSNVFANKLMALFLATTSLWLIDNFMRIAGIYGQQPDYYFKPIYYSFAFGPLLYFYVRSIVNGEFRFKKHHLIHFMPVAFQSMLYIFLSVKDYAFKHWYWEEIHLPFTYRLEFDGSFISMAIYLYFSLLIIRDYQVWIKDQYSELSKIQLNWLRLILFLMLLLTIQWFVELILREFYGSYYNYNFSPFILGFLTLVLAFKAFYQEDQKDIIYAPEELIKEKIKKVDFDPDVHSKIEQRMKDYQDYLDPKLSLKSFAANCQLPQKLVSQYLNQNIQKSFHEYVNAYRVEKFKELVKSKKEENMTLEGIAYDCGFNSRATFNRTFKKITGMTPGQFVSK